MLIEALSGGDQISQKEEAFFLGHLCSGTSSRSEVSSNYNPSKITLTHLKGPRVKRAYRIISGGPSRGSIALEADNAPSEGEMVQVSMSILEYLSNSVLFSSSTKLQTVR